MSEAARLCAHFNDCGGCDLQDRSYAEQLSLKQERVRGLFAELEVDAFEEIVPSPEIWHYRNKMEYIIGGGDSGVSIGLRRKKEFRRVVAVKECRIFHEKVAEIFGIVKEWMRECGIEPYHLTRHTGTMRYVGLRHSKAYGEMMAIIVAAMTPDAWQRDKGAFETLAGKLVEFEGMASVYLCLNSSVADVAVAGEPFLLRGRQSIKERINDIDYLIDPLAFFQTNPSCCRKLYETVSREARGAREGDAIDLFCGSGGIALQIAKDFKKVIGVDIAQKNIDDAVRNAAANDIGNCEFIAGDAEAFLCAADTLTRLVNVRTIIVDPPRAGLTRKTKEVIAASGITTFVYVSCNPASLRDDLLALSPSYRIAKIIPVDMFPHTRHVETIAVLKNVHLRDSLV